MQPDSFKTKKVEDQMEAADKTNESDNTTPKQDGGNIQELKCIGIFALPIFTIEKSKEDG